MNASWVAIDLMEFAVRTEDAVQSPEAALEWLRSFRDTLLMEGRNSRPMPWAVELLGMADVKIAKKSLARMQGQIVKIYGKDCDVEMECSKKYGEKYEKLKKILAAAATREGVDVVPDRESGPFARTTGCNTLTADGDTREDSQAKPDGSAITRNETRAHDALEPSANIYDQETIEISTSDPQPEGLTGPSHGGSVASLEAQQCLARESRRAGGNSLRVAKVSTSPARSSGPVKAAYGEFGNVMLTTDEYIKLCEKCQDADSLITELDQYIESQGKAKKYKSHYATLLNWSRRKATEAKQPSRYKNINDINRENCEQIERDLRAMFHPEEVI